MPVTKPSEFVTLLQKSELLASEQVAKFRAQADRQEDVQKFARELVRKQYLTRWQAEQLLAGRYLFDLGNYRLIERIGKGGMGDVYKAEQLDHGRMVAIKVLSRRSLTRPGSIARFRREVKMAASVDHVNIVATRMHNCHFIAILFGNFCAGKIQIGFFFNRQSIHISSQ